MVYNVTMESDINTWILERLSDNHPAFNDLPACPFAKEALLNNRVVIHALDNNEDFYTLLDAYTQSWPEGKEVVVLGCTPDHISSADLTQIVDTASEDFLSSRGYIALEDHPDETESVAGYVVNQGSYALVLLQSAQKLNKARLILDRKGYYKHWDSEYKQEVLSRA